MSEQLAEIPRQVKPLFGRVFGDLRVVSFAGLDRHKRALWDCLCSCGFQKQILSQTLLAGRATSCGACLSHLPSAKRDEHTRDRILNSVSLVDGCWVWQLGRDHDGYGQIKMDGRTKRAHVVAYTAFNGPIEKGLYVLHVCDNPACCNPNHLFLGTNADNVADMCQKGRQSRGETAAMAKLREEQITVIREMYASGQASISSLARMNGVVRGTIRFVVQNKTWRHIDGGASQCGE